MKRLITLRSLQLLEHLKQASLVMAVMLAIGGFLGAIVYFWGYTQEFVQLGYLSTPHVLKGLGQLISVILTLWVVISCFSDGLSDFDAALRFGVNRRDYAIANFGIYTVMSVLQTLIMFFSEEQVFLSIQDLSLNFWGNLSGCFLTALFAFAIYKRGWEVLFLLLIIPIVSGIGFVLLDAIPTSVIVGITKMFLNMPPYAHQALVVAQTILMITCYYWVVAKVEVK
ncbi:hypothetical protein ACMZ6Z_06280 [Streptococcus pluranimalium]|uniref:hypothetical protein n=1 Tax=Streptococcus pluranimalium TaxID=82348 RepID=UPI0039FD7E0E